MPSDKEEENTPQGELEHKLEQKVAPQNALKEQEVTPLKSAELLQSQVKREFKEKRKLKNISKLYKLKTAFLGLRNCYYRNKINSKSKPYL